MFRQIYDGEKYSFHYQDETSGFILHDKDDNTHLLLQDDDAEFFMSFLDIYKDEETPKLKERIERVIKIYFFFRRSCPVPYFVEA